MYLVKLMAEVLGTYFMIFAGYASVVVNMNMGTMTFPGICIVWGLVVMVMVYSLGHISGPISIQPLPSPSLLAKDFHGNMYQYLHMRSYLFALKLIEVKYTGWLKTKIKDKS